MIKHNDYITNKVHDTFNRMIETEIYLDKYLPYNCFVQFTELLHVALPRENLKKLEDYEHAKLQNYLAEILLDMGHQNHDFDKKHVDVPLDGIQPKSLECECTQKDFKHILHKQVKLSARNIKVIRKVQDKRRLIFRDALAYNPDDVIKENNLMLRTYV